MTLAFVQPLGALFRCGPDHHLYVDHWLLFVCVNVCEGMGMSTRFGHQYCFGLLFRFLLIDSYGKEKVG